MIKAVVLAGGSGTRLWPLSRAAYPKQFVALDGQSTMLQATAKRLHKLGVESSVTICNERHRFLVAEQLHEIDMRGSIILEPEGKNTAPAIALAAFQADDDPLLLVLAADHLIKDEEAFLKAVRAAKPLAEAGELVTFGIIPKEPNTGYGYIKAGSKKSGGFNVDSFKEKPSLEDAQQYCSSGEYYWNSGMFLFKSSRYLEELKKFCPKIYDICRLSINEAECDLDFLRVSKSIFSKCPSESVDYAVMEKTSNAVVVPMNAGWSDVGSWRSVWEMSEKDENGNAGKGDIDFHGSNNCFVSGENQFVSAIGVSDLTIVCTKDAVMVAHKDAIQDIKLVVNGLKANGRSEWDLHRKVFRPWGNYDSLDKGDRFQVKKIVVKPGAKLSVQMHHHRAEHWVVVSGTAQVTIGESTTILVENQSTYIPVGTVHALENPGKIDLELIEIQSGAYLDEDDIVRFEDRYGRV